MGHGGPVISGTVGGGRDGPVTSLTSELARLSGPLAYLLVAALVFGETAIFLGFVIPGETAAVLGGVLASRGRVSLLALTLVVVLAAVIGPLAGYEIGRHLGGRLLARPRLSRVADRVGRARSVLHRRGGVAVFLGRFIAVLRAMMPAVAWHGPDALSHVPALQRAQRGRLGRRVLPAGLRRRVRVRGHRAHGRHRRGRGHRRGRARCGAVLADPAASPGAGGHAAGSGLPES